MFYYFLSISFKNNQLSRTQTIATVSINFINNSTTIYIYNIYCYVIILQISTMVNIVGTVRQFMRHAKSQRGYSIRKFTKHAAMSIFNIFIYLTTFVYFAMRNPEKITLGMSKTAEKISQVHIPKFLRKRFFSAYSKYYQVRIHQIIQPIDSFITFSQFFTRKIHPRNIDTNLSVLTSPADSKILKISEITSDTCSIIKNASYSLGQLLTGQKITYTQDQINQLKVDKSNKLFQIIFYLAPGDYHRFHCPVDYVVTDRKQIQGVLLSVSEKTLIKRKKVYEKNARLCVHGKWQGGYMGLVMVGALNVGRIIVTKKDEFKKGEQMGYFNLGSTVVMIFQAKDIKEWKKAEKDKVFYGEGVCQVVL